MKKMLIEKLESFAAAPFTIQRISELLADPRKQYSRIDKFMRAVEKTILVVSTVPPGRHRSESENGDSLDSALNGDFSTEVNVDIDMEHDSPAKELPKVVAPDTLSIETTAVKIVSSISKESEAGSSKTSDGKTESQEPKATETAETAPATPATPALSPNKETTVNESETLKKEKEDITETQDGESKQEVDLKVETSIVQIQTKLETVVAEPVVDDAPSKEPIRSADNEILVDTSEIISETTPLAALENIVAIRTETATDNIETPNTLPLTVASKDSETKAEEASQETPITEDEPEVEAKRLKMSEAEAPVATEKVAEKMAPEEVSESIATVPTPVIGLTLAAAPVESAEAFVVEQAPIVEEKIDEPEAPEIPIEIIPTTEDIAETPSTDMETVPITITENTMSLDEEDPPALESEMTPIGNKMDTDETEAAPMDFEDDAEPMDQ